MISTTFTNMGIVFWVSGAGNCSGPHTLTISDTSSLSDFLIILKRIHENEVSLFKNKFRVDEDGKLDILVLIGISNCQFPVS